MTPETPRSQRRAPSLIALAAVIAAAVIVGRLVYAHLVVVDWILDGDEPAHALWAELIAHDLRQGDLPGLLFDTYRQVYWPPLHSWLVGLVFLVTGPSLEAARSVSTVAFVLLAPALFLLARATENRDRLISGCVAAALALSSPGLIRMASLNMLELPGLLALTMTMLVFCVIERDPPGPPSRHILLGVCAVLTYLVKTNYGILIIVSIFSTRWMESDFRARGLLTRANLYVLLPIAAFALIWFAYPAKLASTWMALVNEPWGDEETRGLAGLLFYPRAIADYVGSWWMSILLWAGLAMAWKTRGRPGVRLLAVVATTQFVLGLLHHTKVERHIMPMLPAMFVLFGVGVAEVWARVRSVGSRAPAVAIALGSSLAILYAVALARSDLPTVRPYKTTAIMDYISALARDNAPSVVIGTIGASLQPPDLDWHLVAAEALMPVTAAGYVVDPRQEARRPEALGHAGLFARLRAKAVEVLGIRVPRSELRTFHADPLGEDDGAQIEPLIERALEQGQPQAIIVTMGIGDAGGQPPGDLVMTLAQRGFTQAEVRDFPGAGTRVALFRRR